MLFTNYTYAVLVLIAFSAYHLGRRLSPGRQLQNLALLLPSYAFYALWHRWRWCLMLLGVTASGYADAAWLARLRARRSRSTSTRGGSVGAQNMGIMPFIEFAIGRCGPGYGGASAR